MDPKMIFVPIITLIVLVTLLFAMFSIINVTNPIIEDILITKQIIIEEGFESWLPDGWVSHGCWISSLYGEAHTGEHWAFSFAANDTLTTPNITFEPNTELSFWYRCEDSAQDYGNLSVLVNEEIVLSHFNFTNNEYQQATVDLSNYTGTHNISFFNHDDTLYGILLDDVVVSYPTQRIEPVNIREINSTLVSIIGIILIISSILMIITVTKFNW